jgi:F0F1-type ATP synthase delta subunit
MKKLPKKFLTISYKNETLDDRAVKTIAGHLNRNLLKQYIRLLKQEEKKKVVFVTTPKPLSINDRQKIKKFFPKKEIIEQIDPAMINGIKIVENDEAYEMDLNKTFHDIMRFIGNND